MRDLRAELLRAEASHFAQKTGVPQDEPTVPAVEPARPKRQLEAGPGGAEEEEEEENEDSQAKRRRVLEETREIDADSEGGDSDSSEEDRWVLAPRMLRQ